MNFVVESYEHYREEERLTTNNARRIEFITTIRALNEIFPADARMLDCAAGTGIYAFYYGEKGYDVTALDITPRHIEIINNTLKSKSYNMKTGINDATDLSKYQDESFDIVLCMGPMYHLTEKSMREKCISECIRVLKKGGLLAVSYISRFSTFPYVATSDLKYLNTELAKTLINTGTIKHDDPNCFWTDTYYATPEEMEKCYCEKHLRIEDHFTQDGLSPLLRHIVDTFSEEQFKIWCEYHYSICREKSILGASNHGLIVGRK